MTTSKTIRDKLLEKIPKRRMYTRIEQVKRTAQNSITSEVAMYVVASQENISVPKILKKENKDSELDDFQQAITTFDFETGVARKPKPPNSQESKEKTSPFDFPLSKFNIDQELIRDCKIQQPYRNAVKEALLTLETKIQKNLNVDSTHYGVALITEAKKKGVFDRIDKGESEGLYFLFRGAIQWLRNPSGHKKVNYSKEDAIKIVLFADHLISLFDDLFNKRI